MNKKILITIGIIIVALLMFNTSKPKEGKKIAGEIPIEQVSFKPSITSSVTTLGAADIRGQTFTTANSFTITSVKLRLSLYSGTPTGLLNIGIRNTAGTIPSGPDLTSGSIAITSIPSSMSLIEIPINQYILQPSTKYAIILSLSNSNSTLYLYRATGDYLGGDTLSSLTSSSTLYDAYFEIWGTPLCTPNCGTNVCGLDPICGTLSCGSCLTGYSCSSGQCVQQSTCPSDVCTDNSVTFDEYITIGNKWINP